MIDGMEVLEVIEDWLYDEGLSIGTEVSSCTIENGNVIIKSGNKTFMLTVVKN
tara:strand:- start:11497 stop:11655 length:159 start_codon:yes stop_codon:yes gene_type:complete